MKTITGLGYNQDIPAPTHCMSFGAGGLWHARFYFERYTKAKSVFYINAMTGFVETDINSAMINLEYIQYIRSVVLSRSVKLAAVSNEGKIYSIKAKTGYYVKIGLRGSVAAVGWGDEFVYKTGYQYGTASVQVGLGINITLSRFTQMVLEGTEVGSARETRFFLIPTHPMVMLFDQRDTGWVKVNMREATDYYQYGSSWGYRLGIEHKHLTGFSFKRYIIGINAYFIVENNRYFSIGYGSKPSTLHITNPTMELRAPRSYIVGLGYSFMRKRAKLDNVEFTKR